MINLVTKIFELKKHKIKESPNLLLFFAEEYQNYWVVIQRHNELEKIISNQIEIFLESKVIIGEPGFDKNANLLILYKVGKIEEIKHEDILQIEEDPYHFKKSVIYYTDNELAKLESAIADSSVISFIEDNILDNETFETHKSAFDSNDYQSLLYRIAHKIPFINVNVTHTNNIESLEAINRSFIKQHELNALLEETFFEPNDVDFDSLTDEFILESLKKILPDENT